MKIFSKNIQIGYEIDHFKLVSDAWLYTPQREEKPLIVAKPICIILHK